MNKKVFLIGAILYSILLLISTTLPSAELPKVNDKTAHFVAFAVFAIVWLLVKSDYLRVIIAGFAFGVLIEFWQGILPESFHRSFEVLDMIADGIGTLIGCLIFYLVGRVKKKYFS